MSDNFVFFWGGEFSQWYPSPFKQQGMTFNCAEQWMMYSKATYFKDYDTADAIMLTDSPKEQKSLGRQVRGFDDQEWMLDAYNVVVQGNRAKFSQNDDLGLILKNTGSKIIVEASPYDKRWGIGLGENNPDIYDQSKWKGENLLGKAIMQVRGELFGT